MQNKNQISVTRKTLYGIMLLGLFFSVFGAGKMPSAKAQEEATSTPIPEVRVQETGSPTPEGEARITGGKLANPSGYPRQAALNDSHFESSFLSQRYLPASNQFGLESQVPVQAESDLSAQALTLGAVGLSFSYAQTFGTSEIPYLADTEHLNFPWGIATDGANVLIGESWGHRVLKYANTGTHVSTIGTAGTAYNDGEPWEVFDMAVDASGQTWVVDNGGRVIKFDAANNFLEYFHDDGTFSRPAGIAFDGAGNIYISDGGAFWSDDVGHHHVLVFDSVGNQIGQIGTTDISGTGNNQLYGPQHLTVYGNKLYIADAGNNRVQIFDITNPATPSYSSTIGTSGESGTDNTHFDHPVGIAVDTNYIYVADRWNNRIQFFNQSTGEYMTGIGTGWGTGVYQFKSPTDVAIDSAGNIYVADFVNNRVQQFNSSFGLVRTFGVTGVPYLTANGYYNSPSDVAIAPDGSMYITEDNGHRLIKLNANGTTAWTIGAAGVKGDWDNGENDRLNNPGEIALSAAGKVYVADRYHGRVQVYNPDGAYAATLGGGTGNYSFWCPSGLTIDQYGYIYVTDGCRQRVQIFNSLHVYVGTLGLTDVSGSDNAHFNNPSSVAVDGNGFIYVADSDNLRVQVFNSSSVYVRTLGVTGISGDGFGFFAHPDNLAVDSSNRLYVSDTWNQRVQVFDTSGAYLTTIGGAWGSQSGMLRNPRGLSFDKYGALYVADWENHRIQKFTIGTPGWAQVNLNGFGDSTNRISTLGNFGNQLYAGTYNFGGNGSQLWRSTDGENWSNVMSNGFGDATNVGIDHLIEFNGRLYAGIWNATNAGGTNGGQIWRSDDGSTWDQVVNNGFGDPTNGEVMRLVVFNNKIYAGTWSSTVTHGAEIWSSATGDLGDWTKVVNNGSGNVNNRAILTMEIFNGHLYAGTYSWDSVNNRSDGCEVWRTDGVTWTTVADSFGDLNCYRISSLTTFGDSLYAAISNWDSLAQTSTGGQVWRCTAASLCDEASDWTQLIADGFGNSQNQINSLRVLGTRLYAIAENYTTGIEVWKTGDGANWQQVGFGGFGDSNNSAPYWDNSAVVFNNNLFIGTTNWANGGEIWRSLTPVEVHIGGELKGSYFLAAGQSTRQNYGGIDSGPVKVESTNGMSIIAAIRDAWSVNGVTTSFSQLMGLPLEQLSNKYVFPGYNNVTLNEQLRIANVDTVQTTVTVTIGGVVRGTYTLYPPGSLLGASAVRINYPGLDSGPVVIEGTAGVKIIAAIREAWAVNGVTTSFIQLMGLPAGQLSNKYVFPAYNNVTLNEQLRIANVDTVQTTVTVRIGGVLQGTYTLYPPGSPLGVSAVRVNYAGLDSGPVIVEGTPNVKIISAIRDAWAVDGVTTSFSQLMGMPAEQLSNKYLFPAYNNVTLNEQLRISNVDSVPSTVTVTIGGVPRGTYTLYPPGSPLGASAVRINYAGLDSGPVVVEGTVGVKIISAIREAWAVNGVTKSFVQLMGLPAGQLSTTFLFPAYNNVTLNEQLRFGVP